MLLFSIFKPQITLENKDITIFEGIKGNSGIEYVQIGIFTVTKKKATANTLSTQLMTRCTKLKKVIFQL